MNKRWVTSQIGLNGGFFISRALRRKGRLAAAFCSLWHRRDQFKYRILERFYWNAKSHYHPELADFPVQSFFWKRIYSELWLKRGIPRHSLHAARISNQWYQRELVRLLNSRANASLWNGPPGVFFSWSYIAKDVIPVFQKNGWKCVIMQIDGAEHEERIVAEEVRRHPELGAGWASAPEGYFADWREEFTRADHLVVNSPWGRECLLQCGAPEAKVSVIPFAADELGSTRPPRRYPDCYTSERPMRVLYLGQMTLRKGVARLFDAVERLRGAPISFDFAGAGILTIPSSLAANPSVHFHGRVSTETVQRLYREADVFILPTLSDAFALTQLEAMRERLPILASRHCGQVVEHGVNGFVLDEVSGEAIARQLEVWLHAPSLLQAMSERCRIPPTCSLDNFGRELCALEPMLFRSG